MRRKAVSPRCTQQHVGLALALHTLRGTGFDLPSMQYIANAASQLRLCWLCSDYKVGCLCFGFLW